MPLQNIAEPDVQLLSEFQHARIRTEMYLGPRDPYTQQVLEYPPEGPVLVETTWVPALFTAYREIVDNALDEMSRLKFPRGSRLDIVFDPETMIFTMTDNGSGIPIAFDDANGMHKATLAMTKTKAGRNFGERGDGRGLNGVGGSVVNFCSEFFDLDIVRDGMNFLQYFDEGLIGTAELVVGEPTILPAPDKAKSGTRIRFKPSSRVFHDMRLPESFIRARVQEIALCCPALKVTYNGVVVPPKKIETELFPNRTPITFQIDVDGFKSRFWLVPDFVPSGGDYAYSLVNTIPMFQGGNHIDQFRRSFFSGLITALERESKRRKLVPNRFDISDGLLIYNITQMVAPSFDGQAKTRLTNDNVAVIIRKTMDDPAFFKGVIASNPEWIDSIYQRCADRTQKKDAADLDKATKKGKREKVEGLVDACAVDRSKCILMLTEGLSAIAGLNEVRDIETIGGIALRGKPMNVFGRSIRDVMANGPLTDIMKSIGLFPNQRVNRHTLRYGRVYLLMDADEDGSSIISLLIGMFYSFWPELFSDPAKPFLFVLDTPLIIASKGKQRKYWYKDEVRKFNPEQHLRHEVTRAKGLAALEKTDWAHVLEHPKLTPITDDGHLGETLSMLFDPDRAEDRKQFMGIQAG